MAGLYPCKFRVDPIYIAISTFLSFGLRLSKHAHFFVVFGGIDAVNNFSSLQNFQKGHLLVIIFT